MRDLDAFTRAYIDAALSLSYDTDDQPLDKDYDVRDLAEETLKSMVEDCRKFQRDNAKLLEDSQVSHRPGSSKEARAGCDFWLDRNRHGCGFWDGDWTPQENGDRLSEAALAFGECDLYVGDDGELYLEEG